MKMCNDHWDKCRARIDDLGLTQFCSKTIGDLGERITSEVDAVQAGVRPDPSKIDPLSSMTFQFYGRAVHTFGLQIMAPRDPAADDGMPKNGDDYCPLCVVNMQFRKHHDTPTGMCGEPGCTIEVKPDEKPWDDSWIEECSAVIYKGFVERGQIKHS